VSERRKRRDGRRGAILRGRACGTPRLQVERRRGPAILGGCEAPDVCIKTTIATLARRSGLAILRVCGVLADWNRWTTIAPARGGAGNLRLLHAMGDAP